MISSIYKLYPQVVRTVGDEAFDVDGNLVAYDKVRCQALADNLAQIAQLESTVTPRRIREATLTVEGKAWLEGVDAQITALRE